MPPSLADCRTIVIVGAGFGGAVTAAQLLRLACGPLRVIPVNVSGRMARGLAYGTHSNAHVLNLPAGNMSALPDDPDDFLRYCRWSGPGVRPESFVPRRLNRAYLVALLSATELKHDAGLELQRVVGRVVSISAPADAAGAASTPPPRATLQLEDGRQLQAEAVVLAFGHFAPIDPLTPQMLDAARARYVRDPWQPGALAAIGPDEDLLLVGAGLTAVDVALALDRAAHRGRVTSISRRGLPPQSHRRSGAVPSLVDGAALAASGRIELKAARLRGLRQVQAIVDCTGPSADLRRSGSPLIAQRLADGLLVPDPLGLGLQVDVGYRVIDRRGCASAWLHYIGPLLKAREWEATAVPELRQHAQRLAQGPTAPG